MVEKKNLNRGDSIIAILKKPKCCFHDGLEKNKLINISKYHEFAYDITLFLKLFSCK